MYNTILINSKDRIVGTSNDFRIEIQQLKNVNKVELLSVSIPNTIYNVSTGNNTIIFNEGSSDLTAILNSGAYDIYELMTQLDTSMNSVSTATYVSSYNPVTFRLTITSTVNFIVKNSNILYTIGFLNHLTFNTVQTSDYAVRLQIPKNYFIYISELGTDFSKSTGSNRSSNFIITSQVNSTDIDFYFQNSHYNIVELYQKNTLTSLSISIFDEAGNLIDMNGSDWTILLRFSYNPFDEQAVMNNLEGSISFNDLNPLLSKFFL